MRNSEPEELNDKTPQWFKDWHEKGFWHFRHRVETMLSIHGKLLWGIIIAIIAGAVLNIIFG